MITVLGLFAFGVGVLGLCHRGFGAPDGPWPPWYDDERDGP